MKYLDTNIIRFFFASFLGTLVIIVQTLKLKDKFL